MHMAHTSGYEDLEVCFLGDGQRTRRAILTGLAVGALAPLLAACGAAGPAASSTLSASAALTTAGSATASSALTAAAVKNTASASVTAKATTVTAANVVTGKGPTLRLYDGIDPTKPSLQRDALNTFTTQTGITVETDPSIPGKWDEKLLVQASSGTAPDVTVAYGDPLYNFQARDVLLDITSLVARDIPQSEVADWLPSQYNMLKYKGHQLGLPKYCGTSAFYGNTNLFQQSGVTFPGDTTTWDTFRSNLISLTKSQGGTTTQFGLDNGLANIGYVLSWMVWSWGGEVVDPKDNSKCLLDQPPALDALQYMQDLIWKDHVSPQPADLKQFPTGGFLFSDSHTATNRNGSWEIQNWHKKGPKGEWDVFANPLGPTGKRFTFHTTDTYAAFKGSKSADATWQLLRYVTGLDWGRMLIQASQLQPAHLSLAPDWIKGVQAAVPESANAKLDVFVKGFDYARPQVAFSNDPKANALLDPVLDAVYNKNTMTARQGFAEVAPRVTAALQGT
jgi:multiple sugar transport system substrate-binding protein